MEILRNKAQDQQRLNKELFDKSYFGKLLKNRIRKMGNLHTPDRDINPPDDRFKQCEDCKGSGTIWSEPEDGEEEELIQCHTCGGDGEVLKDEEDEEW